MKTTNTSAFRKWREKAKLDKRQAAERLGLRRAMVDYLDSGTFEPRADTRMLMQFAIDYRGKPPLKPWKPSDV